MGKNIERDALLAKIEDMINLQDLNTVAGCGAAEALDAIREFVENSDEKDDVVFTYTEAVPVSYHNPPTVRKMCLVCDHEHVLKARYNLTDIGVGSYEELLKATGPHGFHSYCEGEQILPKEREKSHE